MSVPKVFFAGNVNSAPKHSIRARSCFLLLRRGQPLRDYLLSSRAKVAVGTVIAMKAGPRLKLFPRDGIGHRLNL
jgi:hypothetical protein